MKKLILATTLTALLLPAAAQAQTASMSAEQVGSATSVGIDSAQTLVLLVILAAALAVINAKPTPMVPA